MGTVVVPRIAGAVSYDPTNVAITGGSIGTATTGLPTVLAVSGASVATPADTSEDTLATITVPAGTLGANGQLYVSVSFSATNNANNKTIRIRYSGAAGTVYGTTTFSTQLYGEMDSWIRNTNATNAQTGAFRNGTGGSGMFQGAQATSSVDTTASTTIVITGQKASAGDTLTLLSYLVYVVH